MKELMHNVLLKRQTKRGVESALHDQELAVSFAILVYVSILTLKLIIPNKSLFKINLKTMLLYKTPCCLIRKHSQNC